MIQISNPIMPTTISTPTQTPALKIPSTSSQLENNVITKSSNTTLEKYFFMVFSYDGLLTVKLRQINKKFII